MVDEYSRLTGDATKASFTGKSTTNGGSLGRSAATGRGGVIALRKLFELRGQSEKHFTMAIQGFGNVGSYFGTVAAAIAPNWRLVAVSDSQAGVFNRAGLDAAELKKFKDSKGRFKDYSQPGAEVISNDDLLALDADILVLAGLEDSLTAKNMSQVRAKYIVEMANGPITRGAFAYLSGSEKVILPDIIANAGGVIVSYLEWRQNIAQERWEEDRINRQLAELMEKAVNDMYVYSSQNHTSLKHAAFAIAVKRLTAD
jgi:glutamate dehydrogenase/leucine dehydrogenase